MNIAMTSKWGAICFQTHSSLLHKPAPHCHFSSLHLIDLHLHLMHLREENELI